MPEPIGTTRVGQAVIGSICIIVSYGFCAGLFLLPAVFEPILKLSLLAFEAVFRVYATYDPVFRPAYAIGIAFIGTVGAALMGHAFYREPLRNRTIDSYLTRHDQLDHSRRASATPSDGPES